MGDTGGIGVTVGDGQFQHGGSGGFWLGERYWGRGIMSEALPAITSDAFERLGLIRVSATVFEWNPASMRVFEKAGWKPSGQIGFTSREKELREMSSVP